MHPLPHLAFYGPPGAGKSAIANALVSEFGYRRFSLRGMTMELSRLMVDRKLDRGRDFEMIRRLRQAMCDPYFGGSPTFWIERLDDRIAEADWMRPVVIDDVETVAEAEWLKHHEGVLVVRVDTDIEECMRRVRGWANGIMQASWFAVEDYAAIAPDDQIPGVGDIHTNIRGLIANNRQTAGFQELVLEERIA